MLNLQDQNISLFFSKEKAEYPLLGEEIKVSSSYSKGRKIDFATGRFCARKALEYFGLFDVPIPSGEKREPLWPDGFVGSISHCNRLTGSAIARMNSVVSVGLDIEELGRVKPDIWNHVFTENEKIYLRSLDEEKRKIHSTLFFAAKEAYYKFQFPLTKKFMGFLDVEVIFSDSNLNIFIVESAFRKSLSAYHVDVHIAIEHDVVICLIMSRT